MSRVHLQRLLVLPALLAVYGCAPHARPPMPPSTPAEPLAVSPRDSERVSLIAFGDWGAASDDQRAVAAAIRSFPEPADAALLLGDNFYISLSPGARSEDDPWRKWFDDLYGPTGLAFYAVLGNHDYEVMGGVNKAQAQLDRGQGPTSRFRMPARWYRMDVPATNPRVAILLLDSNRRDMWRAEWNQQTDWIRSQLQALHPKGSDPASVPWVICCAHHPIFTNGRVHGDQPTLNADWLPLFNEYQLDFYLCGHNHCLEHVREPGKSKVSYVVSGGGGQGLYRSAHRHPGKYFGTHGFVRLDLDPARAKVTYVSNAGVPFYNFTRDRRTGAEHEGELRRDERFEKGFKQWRR